MLSSLHLIILFFILALLSSYTAASSITITIPSSAVLPNPNILSPETHATLTTKDQRILTTPLTHSSTFVFRHLPSAGASYLLDIRSKDYVFVPYRVDVADDGSVKGVWETPRGHPWSSLGLEKSSFSTGDVVVEAKVVRRRVFYEQRPTCEFTVIWAGALLHPN